MSAALAVANLYKNYGAIAAVAGVSFSVKNGECYGILGPNGAGKSTTLRVCLAHTEQDSGSVCLLNHTMPGDALAARQRVGVVGQQDNLDPDFDCVQNLKIYARYFGLRLDKAETDYLLDFAGLSERAHEFVPALSGGMQRRLTLARALVNNPDFIFLDEPTIGLDPQARHLIRERLRRLQEQGKTLLLTTHFMEEAEWLCNRVAIMDCGKIIAEDVPATLISEHVEREVVEIYHRDIGDWMQQQRHLYERCDQFGKLAYCYLNDADQLVTALQQSGFRFTRRAANLEDVFLRLTGRDLRE